MNSLNQKELSMKILITINIKKLWVRFNMIESEFTIKANSDSFLFKALLIEKYKQVTQLARVPVSGSHWFESNLVYISFFFFTN